MLLEKPREVFEIFDVFHNIADAAFSNDGGFDDDRFSQIGRWIMLRLDENTSGGEITSVVNELWSSMNQSKFATMQGAVDDACAAGFSAQLLVGALLDKILSPDCALSELSRAEIAIRIAEAEKNMIEGADEYLQFMTVATLVMTCHQKTQRD